MDYIERGRNESINQVLARGNGAASRRHAEAMRRLFDASDAVMNAGISTPKHLLAEENEALNALRKAEEANGGPLPGVECTCCS